MLLQDHRDSLMCTMRALRATEWEILSGGSGLRALADQCPEGGKPCLTVVLGVHSRPSSEANPLTCSTKFTVDTGGLRRFCQLRVALAHGAGPHGDSGLTLSRQMSPKDEFSHKKKR